MVDDCRAQAYSRRELAGRLSSLDVMLKARFPGGRLPHSEQGRHLARLILGALACARDPAQASTKFVATRAPWLAPDLGRLIDEASASPGIPSDEEFSAALNGGEPTPPVAKPSRHKPTPKLQARKRFLKNGIIPDRAMRWADSKEKGEKLYGWLLAVFEAFPNEQRIAKTAAILGSLFNFDRRRGGYAYASNEYLARATCMPVTSIEKTVSKIAAAGFIVRTFTYHRGEPERRIWPALPANVQPSKLAGPTDPEPSTVAGSKRISEPASVEGSREARTLHSDGARTRHREPCEPSTVAGEIRND